MSFKVIKLGGSNLRTSADLIRCAKIVESYNKPAVIVISAFYKVTDNLKKAAEKASDKGVYPGGYIETLSELCYDYLNSSVNNTETLVAATAEMKIQLGKLANLLKGVHAIGEMPPPIYDSILSYGERLSAQIFNSVLNSRGVKSILQLPENFGLITNGDYGSASILLKESAGKISQHFKEDCFYVIPGFYGVSTDGKINLLGRGGTDYSAAAMANLLNADSLDVWKDVDGFQTADPTIVGEPKTISNLSYNEAAELSYFGAKILHPRTVEPLMPKNIPIKIFNVKSPEEGAHTIIGPDCDENGNGDGPKSITYSRNFSVIKFKGPGVGSKPGVLARVAGIMDAAGVNIASVFTSQTAICFLLLESDLRKAKKAIASGSPELINDVEVLSDIALVALVVEGITKKRGIAARAFQAVADRNINVEIIAAGASTAAIYFVVENSECEKAVEATHEHFFGKTVN